MGIRSRRGWAVFTAGTTIGVAAGALATTGVLSAARAHQPAAASDQAAGDQAAVGTHASTAPASTDGLTPFSSCQALRRWYVAATLPLVGPWGIGVVAVTPGGPGGGIGPVGGNLPLAGTKAAAPEPSGSLDTERGPVGNDATGTNVQAAGVDEPDIAKTNGDLLVRVRGSAVVVSDVSGTAPRRLSSVRLPATMRESRLLLVGDRVLVFGERTGSLFPDGPHYYPGEKPQMFARVVPGSTAQDSTRILAIDLARPADPRVVGSETVRGDLVSARAEGGTVRTVFTTGYPAFHFVFPGTGLSTGQALAQNRQIVRHAAAAAWLPSVRDGAGRRSSLAGCTDVLHPRSRAGAGTVSVLAFPAGDLADRSTTAVSAAGDLAYTSADHLFLATRSSAALLPEPGPRGPYRPAPPAGTALHEFALDGARTTYVASASVPGTLLDRWSLDEYDGRLRVATSTGSDPSRPRDNAVLVLDESGGALRPVGRLDGIGGHEEIKAVRWLGDRAVVETYRQTDPVYTLDLSSPSGPRLTGSVRVPGFSTYLHPVGDGRLLGVGRTQAGAAEIDRPSARLTSFALTRDGAVRRVDDLGLGTESGTPAGYRPRTFTYLPAQRLALLAVRAHDGLPGKLVSVAVGPDGRLSESSSWPLDGGLLSRVRTLPLDDDRIAVVGRGVRIEHLGARVPPH